MDLESRCLLEQFPVEVWRLILANVSGTATYHQICAASKVFQTLISPVRLQILFPDVVHHLYNYLYKNAENLPNRDGAACSPLFKCRLVSRNLKQGIDYLFQNLPYHFPPANRRQSPDFVRMVEFSYAKLETHEDFRKAFQFRQYFEDTGHPSLGLNPFVFRSVSLACPEVDQNTTLPYKELADLLQIVGHHVWCCRIIVHGERLDLVCLEKLKNILHLLPNLKVLWMFGFFPSGLTFDQTLQIQQKLVDSPVPVFPRLQYVHSHNLPSSLNHNLWFQNPQLTMLDFRNPCPIFGSVVPSQLQNLTHLAVFFDEEEQFEEFEYTTSRWPNLIKLDLRLQALRRVTWDRIFRFLEAQFGSTVQHLRLVMPNSAPEDFRGQLKMSKLKTVRVRMSTFVCLDFLLPSHDSLEDLILFVNPRVPINGKLRENKIKFFQYVLEYQDLCRSNIWNYFPKLNAVQIQRVEVDGPFQACTREEWIKKREHVQKLQSMLRKVVGAIAKNYNCKGQT